MADVLRIEGLSVTIGARPVLRGVDLTARAGSITAICGANGAGKSTLLRAVLGEVASRGALSLNGRDVRRQAPADLARQRAVLAQDTQMAFAFTVAEVVAMGHEAGAAARDPDVVGQCLHRVGLQAHADRPLHSLSGGERQRAHLARALAQVWQPTGPDGPRWLFLDEPVASLDLGHQLQVMALVRQFAAAGGGVVMVMHDLNLTADVAHHVGFVIDGGIDAEGPPETIITAARLSRAYGCTVALNTPPAKGPWFVPQSCGLSS